MTDVAYYRRRAAQFREKAEKPLTEEHRASYARLAESWDGFADALVTSIDGPAPAHSARAI